MSKLFTTKRIVRAGLIGGLYVALSLVVFPVASGAIQFRPSEALTLLPLLFPEAIPALFVGCALINLITGCAIFDIIFGSVITLVAAVLTYLIGKLIKQKTAKVLLGGIFPVLLNALFLPLIWVWCYGAMEYVYYVQVAFLIISQTVSVYALGVPLYFATEKLIKKGTLR
jgi:uncharacterized membrane protein